MFSWNDHWKEDKGGLDTYGMDCYSAFSKWLEGRKIMEIGFGSGRFLNLMTENRPDAMVVGVENSLSSVLKAKASGARYVILADMFHLPFKDGAFDTVLTEGVIIYYHNYAEAFAEIARTGKRILTCVPNSGNFIFSLYKRLKGDSFEYGWEKSFNEREIMLMYKSAGMRNVEVEGYAAEHAVRRLGTFPVSAITLSVAWVIRFGIAALDSFTDRYVSRKFGFYLCAKGERLENIGNNSGI